MEALKREKLLEVRSSQMGLGEGAYLYAITGAGIARAREALDRHRHYFCMTNGPSHDHQHTGAGAGGFGGCAQLRSAEIRSQNTTSPHRTDGINHLLPAG